MNSKTKGDIAESIFITECLKKGYNISIPFGDNIPYDCIVDTGTALVKVQVKGRNPTNKGSILPVPMQSSKNHITKELYDYSDFVDWVVLVDLSSYKVYKILTSEISNRTYVNLRLIPTKNNQTKGVLLAEDYLF